MKKVILATALLIAAISTTFAGTNTETIAAEKNMSQAIKSQITYPEFLKEKQGEYRAEISFSVSDCGAINLKEVNCEDEDLKNYVVNQIGSFKVNTYGLDTHSTYKVVIRFETL
jgi:hypothetical protein